MEDLVYTTVSSDEHNIHNEDCLYDIVFDHFRKDCQTDETAHHYTVSYFKALFGKHFQ